MGNVLLSRAGDPPPPAVKPGAVTGTVPAPLLRIPLQLTAQVGTAGLHRVGRTLPVPVNAGFFAAPKGDAALSRRDIRRRLPGNLEQAPLAAWPLSASIPAAAFGEIRPGSNTPAQAGAEEQIRSRSSRAATMEEVMPHF